MKESAVFIAGRQVRNPGQLVLKKRKLPEGFQRKTFKDRLREGVHVVCDQLMDIFLIGGHELIGNHIINLLILTGVESVCLLQHTVKLFHLVRASVSAKTSKDMAQNIFYSPRGGTKCP